MKLRVNELLGLLILTFIYVISMVLVVSRPLDSPNDTYSYFKFFENVINFGIDYDGRFESGFFLITYLATLFSESHHFYFFILYSFLFCLYLGLYKFELNFNNDFNLSSSWVFFSLILSSGWFYTASVNGLRQGLASIIVILGFLFFSRRKYKLSFLFLFLSTTFHISTILVIPFVLVIFLNLKFTILLFIILAVFYPLGVNEGIIKLISTILNIPLYNLVKNYLDGIMIAYEGFQIKLFLYTVFMFCFFIIMKAFIWKERKKYYDFLLKTYAALSMCYFVFGFGNFSNRYAFFCWTMIPIIQAYIILSIRFSYNSKVILYILCLFFGMSFFIMRSFFLIG